VVGVPTGRLANDLQSPMEPLRQAMEWSICWARRWHAESTSIAGEDCAAG
jgi:hypothetical protein